MSWDYIGEGVTNADDRPAEIIVAKAAGFIKSTTGYHFIVHEGALGKFLCHDEKEPFCYIKESLYILQFALYDVIPACNHGM